MFLTAEEYSATPVAALLLEVAKGRVPLDHRLLKVLIDRKDETLQAIVDVGNGPQSDWRFDISEDLLNLAKHFNDPRTIPFLIDLLNVDEPIDEVYEAYASLGASAIEPLLAAYAAEEDDPEFRENVSFAMAALGVDDSRIEKILTENHGSDTSLDLYRDRGERHVPDFDLFAEYPEAGVPMLEALSLEERLELLKSADEDYRIGAAASLFHEDLSPAQVTTIFAAAKADPSEHVRAHLWQALDNSLDQAHISSEMLSRVQNPATPEFERCGLVVGLAARAELPEIRQAILDLYENPETRLKALEAMWRSHEPDFAEYFPKHLEDEKLDIRRIALRGIGVNGLTAEMGRIRKLLEDPDLREDALFAYALTAPAKVSPAFLRTLYKKLEKEAGGFTSEEDEVVRLALDERLRAHGKAPLFVEEFLSLSLED